MNRTKGILALVVVSVLVGWIGFGHTSESVPRAARAISALLDYDGSLCMTNCELSNCEFGDHKNIVHGLGNDGGLVHDTCWWGSCRLHDCNPNFTLAPSDLDAVVDLLSSLDAKQIMALHEVEPNLAVNPLRSAVQIFGCQGAVLASVALAPEQARQLEALEDR